MKDSNLTLHFNQLSESQESYLTTLLGLITTQIGLQLVITYLERISKTKNILDVWINQPRKNEDISKKHVYMAYQNSPVHIKSISQMLTTCIKCTDLVLKSNHYLDLPKVGDLLRECGYQFDTTEHLSTKDANAKKAAIISMITAVVSLVSMASSGGTVSGATCATVAIGLFGTRVVDVNEAATPRLYGEVGIRTTNDVLVECRKWVTCYNNLEKIQRTKYELTKLEYKLLKKIIITVGESLRFTGMALRSYVSHM